MGKVTKSRSGRRGGVGLGNLRNKGVLTPGNVRGEVHKGNE